MGKRNLDDIFNNDPLGLLNVEIKDSNRHNSNNTIVNGFNEINNFFDHTGREPQINSSSVDELRLAARLDTFRKDVSITNKLLPHDKYQLLSIGLSTNQHETNPTSIEDIFDSELLNIGNVDIFELKHVTNPAKKQSVNEYTANRKPCKDFEQFKHMFEQVQIDLDNNRLKVTSIEKISEIRSGHWFIVQGMIAYVAEMGDKYEHRKGHHNARLRVIFSNKTESDLLLRSFGAALYKDQNARQIYGTDDTLLPKHIDTKEEIAPIGIVYVLRTLSQQNGIVEHREYLHKIGVTGGSVKARIANAENDPTYLLAPVEIVGEFHIYHMNIKGTEKLLKKFFQSAQADIKIKDRFGKTVSPKEWFFVTLQAIKEAVRALQENKILHVRYDHKSGKIVDK